MTEQHTILETMGETVEEAIEKGLTELGLSEQEVETEVLDEGAKGLFGLGSRQARVRITVKHETKPEPVAAPEPPEEAIPPEQSPMVETPEEPQTSSEEQQVLEIARATVTELLEKMKVRAEVTASYVEDDEYRGHKPIWIDIHGDDLSILIGRKAETLNALQYITNLILGKEMGRAVPLTIDVEGYRSRRQKQLAQLARRVAKQVVETQRSQALEPMPARERRLVHIELRDDPDVYTESIGEGDRRKVVIYLKS